MRFPDINVMKRVFHLFHSEQLNSGEDKLKNHLIDFKFSNDDAFHLFNNIRIPNKYTGNATADMFNFINVPQIGASGYETLVNNAIGPFIKKLEDDMKAKPPSYEGWNHLMENDIYSTRTYMSLKLRYDTPTIDWLESMDKSSGWYDRALAETVLESIAFGVTSDPNVKTKWYCLE
jgi:hypothetical protein